MAVVSGGLHDSPLRIARRLSQAPRVLCASPSYLEGGAAPATPGDLASHACLLGGALGRTGAWDLRHGEERSRGTVVLVDGPLRLCSDDTLREAALRGLGIALLPLWLVAEDVQERRLVQVLPELTGPLAPLHVLYARERAGAPKLAPLLEALASQCQTGPWRPETGRQSA